MDLINKITSLAKRRGFVFPGSEIYGGLANSWDYGPLGVELKNNIKAAWWRQFVSQRDDVVGIETALIMNPKVWEASGHLKEFVDPLAECSHCKERFRADQLPKKNAHQCPNCGQPLSPPRLFNLMFKTFMGPAEDSASAVYLRPETAQGMFVNFENVLNSTRKKLPFGIAQIGKAFRNEITPGNFIFRTREFEQMEIEYFIEEKNWKKDFERWLSEMKKWIKLLGLKDKKIKYKDIAASRRAHYSQRTVDILYEFPFGFEELYGLAYRGDFDTKNHNQEYTDQQSGEKFYPHVIEPTWGVDRTLLALLCEHYHEEEVKGERRIVMEFPVWLAPVKVAVLPLSDKPLLTKLAKQIQQDLLADFICDYDETQSIGKRYRRQDEIGTPFCITVDFDSPKKKDLTVRHRDTMKQDRIKLTKLRDYLADKFKN